MYWIDFNRNYCDRTKSTIWDSIVKVLSAHWDVRFWILRWFGNAKANLLTDLRRRNSHPPIGSRRLGGETTEELTAAAPLVGLEPLCVAWEICSSKGKSEKRLKHREHRGRARNCWRIQGLGDPLQEGYLNLPTGFLTRRCTLKGHPHKLKITGDAFHTSRGVEENFSLPTDEL